jgi:hypothetical protein
MPWNRRTFVYIDRMNYLAHYVVARRESGNPDFLLGAVLPDIVSAWQRQHRFVQRTVTERIKQSDGALWHGIDHHLQSDARFHRMPLFKMANESFFKSFIEHLRPHTEVRIFFLSHVSVEFLLDHLLLEDEPRLSDMFYGAIARCDTSRVAGVLSEYFQTDGPLLESHLRSFLRLRFIDAYRHLDGLLHGLNGMLRRTGQSILQGQASDKWLSLMESEKVPFRETFFPEWKKTFAVG